MTMKNDNDAPEPEIDMEICEHVRAVLRLVHGKEYSLQQIQEAYTIALLTTAIFRDQITQINRRRYGCTDE